MKLVLEKLSGLLLGRNHKVLIWFFSKFGDKGRVKWNQDIYNFIFVNQLVLIQLQKPGKQID